MRTFGIVGRPLGHSFSGRWFTAKFAALGLADECRYLNFPLDDISDLAAAVAQHPDLAGFNVTIPYKQAIIPLLDALSEEAQAVGAVNCVKVADGQLIGYNTDVYGFKVGLTQLLGPALPKDGLKALILGTGGASLAVRRVLDKAGIEYTMVSRTLPPSTGENGAKALAYSQLTRDIIANHRLIINTTPLGTFPDVEQRPELPYDPVGSGHFLYDLVYNPAQTAFLAEGARRGAATINGLAMLHAQAERSWQIWNTTA